MAFDVGDRLTEKAHAGCTVEHGHELETQLGDGQLREFGRLAGAVDGDPAAILLRVRLQHRPQLAPHLTVGKSDTP